MQRAEQSLSQLAGLRNWALWKSVAWGLLSASIPKLNGYSGHTTGVFTHGKKTITLVHSSLLPAFFLGISCSRISWELAVLFLHPNLISLWGEETPCCIGKKSPWGTPSSKLGILTKPVILSSVCHFPVCCLVYLQSWFYMTCVHFVL